MLDADSKQGGCSVLWPDQIFSVLCVVEDIITTVWYLKHWIMLIGAHCQHFNILKMHTIQTTTFHVYKFVSQFTILWEKLSLTLVKLVKSSFNFNPPG